MTAIISAAILLFAQPSHAVTSSQQAAFGLKAYKEILIQCPEKLWPGIDWSQSNLLFVSYAKKKVWQAGDGPRIKFRDLPGANEDFQFFEFKGKTSIIMNLDKYAHEDLYMPTAVAVHEMFHRLGQIGWQFPHASRGEIYPLKSEPRYDRAMLMSAFQAYVSGAPDGLSEAAYWMRKWQTDAPEETEFTTDLREGTAHFVERTVVALTRLGCNATPQQLSDYADKWILQQDMDLSIGLDGEGYVLGTAAAFLLERISPDWKNDVVDGTSPLALLLLGQDVKSAFDNPGLRALIADRIEKTNAAVLSWTKPFSENFTNDRYLRIVIPDSWATQSLGFYGFYTPRDAPDRSYALMAAGQAYESPDSKSKWLTVTDRTLALLAPEIPCSKKGLEVLLPKESVHVEQDHYQGHSENLDFDFSGSIMTSGGLDYLCPN